MTGCTVPAGSRLVGYNNVNGRWEIVWCDR